MSIRTTSGAVEAVLQRDYDGNTNLRPFMTAASIIIDNMVAWCSTQAITVLDSTLLEIETWLAAWAYCQNSRPYSELELGTGITKSKGVYSGQTGKGLDSNFYGQTAKVMDPTGYLSNLDETQLTVGMTWLGLPPSQQTPYYQRD